MPDSAEHNAPTLPVYQPMLVLLAGLAAGIIFDRYWAMPIGWELAIVGVGLTAWWCACRWYSATAANVALLLSVAAFGAAWHHAYWWLYPEDEIGLIAGYDPQSVAIEARVLSGPWRVPAPPEDMLRATQVGDRSRLQLQVMSVRDGTQWRPASGKVFASVEGHVLGIVAGDRVRILGTLLSPSPARNPGDFDYAEYCRNQRVLALLHCDTPQAVQLIQRGSQLNPRRWIDQLRGLGQAALQQSLQPRQAGLAAAMFLGAREELDLHIREAFRETGTVHLLVISGLNVGILAACVLWLCRLAMVSDTNSLVLLATITILYAVLTGAQPPVVRATALVLVYCGARLLGRPVLAYNAWAAAAIVVLLINPSELFQAGTQLSFLAVAVLVGLGQSWLVNSTSDRNESPWMAGLPSRWRVVLLLSRQFGQLIAVSAVVWVVVQPLVASRFMLFTPCSIIVGPLVAVPVVVAMASGFAVITVGAVLPPVGAVLGIVCDRALALLISVVEIAHATPGSFWVTGGPGTVWLLLFYGLLAAYAIVPAVRTIDWRLRTFAAVAMLGWGVMLTLWQDRPHNALRITFLSVGHGLAVVVEFPNGTVWLYDAGSIHGPELAARSTMGYLATRHVRRIDRAIISHADIDHYNAIPRLLKWFRFDEVNYGPRMFAEDSPPLQVLQQALTATGVPQSVLTAGDRLAEPSQAKVHVLMPPAAGVNGSDNANSVVVLIEYAGCRLLLTGDLESPGLEELMRMQLSPITVLLVPHHGSARSDPAGLAEWSRPRHVVVSGSMSDRTPTVRADYEAAGAQVHHTAETGAVEVLIQADGEMRVEHYLSHLDAIFAHRPYAK